MTAPDQPYDLLERLQRGDDSAFEFLYRRYYRAASEHVRQNSGNEQDARDVFQDALLALFKSARSADFVLKAEVGTFLLAIVRKQWLYRLRSRRAQAEVGAGAAQLPDPGTEDLDLPLLEQTLTAKHQVIRELLETLKPECRKLIEYAYYHRLSGAALAALLGYTEAFIKVKKHRCMEALREKVNKHPLFSDEE